jgi:hypothetical protein
MDSRRVPENQLSNPNWFPKIVIAIICWSGIRVNARVYSIITCEPIGCSDIFIGDKGGASMASITPRIVCTDVIYLMICWYQNWRGYGHVAARCTCNGAPSNKHRTHSVKMTSKPVADVGFGLKFQTRFGLCRWSSGELRNPRSQIATLKIEPFCLLDWDAVRRFQCEIVDLIRQYWSNKYLDST